MVLSKITETEAIERKLHQTGDIMNVLVPIEERDGENSRLLLNPEVQISPKAPKDAKFYTLSADHTKPSDELILPARDGERYPNILFSLRFYS